MAIASRKFWAHLVLGLAMIALLAAGCGEEKTSQEPAATSSPPPLPPTSSLVIDLQDFASPTPTPEPSAPAPSPAAGPPELPPPPSFLIDLGIFEKSAADSSAVPSDAGLQRAAFPSRRGAESLFGPAALGDYANWNFAAFQVGFWTLIITVGMAVPVAAFTAAFHNIPLQQADGSWVWSYSVRVAGSVYSARLRGQYIPQGVRWEMFISQEGGVTDFLWYYGESDLPATGGFWILYDKPEHPVELIRIDWHQNIADGSSDIKYTNIEPGGHENGGYIFHRISPKDAPYDAYADIYNKGHDNHTYIEWNRATQEGRVKDLKHFGDSDWHCWNGQHENTPCP